ncbi:MAG: hypothetical protein JSV49_10240 [Thermoplasmata archaeon]|nr:MAG: hypothetical protein JSV49_10240 [Thermoplasmata archaeon]
MIRRSLLIFTISIILLFYMMNANARTIYENDVEIGPDSFHKDYLYYTEEGDEIEVEVTSDIPVNVYIICEYLFDYESDDDDFNEKAIFFVAGRNSIHFIVEIPDEFGYYLVIYNTDGNLTATVDYEYNYLNDEDLSYAMEEAEELFGFVLAVCIAIVVAVVVVIVLIIYFTVFYDKKDKQPPVMPPPPPPPPPPGYYPPRY